MLVLSLSVFFWGGGGGGVWGLDQSVSCLLVWEFDRRRC